jgi:hypothetical protein
MPGETDFDSCPAETPHPAPPHKGEGEEERRSRSLQVGITAQVCCTMHDQPSGLCGSGFQENADADWLPILAVNCCERLAIV